MSGQCIPVREVVKEWFKDPEFVREYDALEEEFALEGAVIGARAHAGLTQEELAAAAGTKLRVSFVPDGEAA
jgi:hypothetical protein